jgi:membrane associated rhomboid family serine protease
MLIPLGHDQPIRHTPWLTTALLLVWTAIDFVRVARLPSRDEWRQARYQQARAEVLVLRRLGGDLTTPPEQALREQAWERVDGARDPQADGLLDQMRAARTSVSGPRLRGAVDELARADAELTALARRDLAVKLAFRPSDGFGPRVLLYAVAHAGWLHLALGGLFLWVVGCSLEDRWGRAAYGGVLVAGALVGAGAHALAFRGTAAGLVGGSTAVAAAMGAFAVCFRGARLRFVRLASWAAGRPPAGAGTRAAIVLPAWFAGEIALAVVAHTRGEATGAAAHAAAFGFGALAALALQASGLERRVLLPRARRGVEWTEAPELVAALDLVAAQRPADAIVVLEAFVARAPQHRRARALLAELALSLGRSDLVAAHLSEALLDLAESDRPDEVVRLYRRTEGAMPGIAPSDRGLLEVARAAAATRAPELAGDVACRLASTHPDSPLVAGALWLAARALANGGGRWPRGAAAVAARRGRAALLCRTIIDRFPADPLAGAARELLGALPPTG